MSDRVETYKVNRLSTLNTDVHTISINLFVIQQCISGLMFVLFKLCNVIAYF